MKKLSANVCAVTHAGRVRKENEDNYSLNGKLTSNGDLKKGSAFVQKMAEPFHLAVCDGMGGESYGEIASGIAVQTMSKRATDIYNSGEDFSFAISNAIDDANNQICAQINSRGKRMGTTLAAVYAVKGRAICVSIGDTRIYHFSNGILEQMSFDHTHGQQIVDAMQVSQDDMGAIPDAKKLTQHLGTFPEESMLKPNVSVIDDVENGDIILLCSDGLTDMLTDDEISAIVSSGDSAQDVTGKLIRKALEKGGKDNVTVLTAFMEVEDSAIFVPIAEAMVGDKNPSYEEEYRHTYGSNTPDDDAGNTSPYANADADAYEQPIDKMKIVKIAVIALLALAVLVAAFFIVRAVRKRNAEQTTSSTTDYYYEYDTTTEITTWFTTTEPTSETSETEEESEETSDEGVVTTQPSSTTRWTTRSNYTRRNNNTTRSTTRSSTTQPTTASTTQPTSSSTTQPTTESTTQPTTESTTQPTTESTTQEVTGNGDNHGGINGRHVIKERNGVK